MDEDILIPFGAFATIALIVWAAQAYSAKRRTAFLQTVRFAIERGVHLAPETIKALGGPERTRHGDIKWGVIWLAIAAACIVFGWAVSDGADFEALRVFVGIAAFPGFVGLALLGFGIATLRDQD